MKKIHTISLLLAGTLLTFAGCKRNSPEPVVTAKAEVSSPIVEIGQTDVQGIFTVTLSNARDVDTEFSVEASSSNTEMYVLDLKKLTVKAGEKSGSGTVTFKASAFSAEKNTATVTVTISTGEKNVTVDKDASSVVITANRKASPVGESATASIEAPGSISVGASDRDVEYTVNLDNPLKEDAVIVVTASGGDAEAYTLKTCTVTIKAGEESAKGIITFIASKFNSADDEVKVKLTISTESSKVKISETNGSVEVVAVGQEGDLPVAEITIEKTSVEVGQEDIPVNYTVTLSETKATDAIITVTPSGDGSGKYSLSKTSLTIPKGSKTVTASIIFKGGAFEGPEDKINITLSITSEDAEISETKGSVSIEACGSVPVVTAAISIDPAVSQVVLGTEDVPVEFKITLSQAVENEVVVAVASAGADESFYELNDPALVIAAGETEAAGTVTLKEGSLSSPDETFSLKLSISSDDVEIGSLAEVVINAEGAEVPATARVYFDEPEINIPSVSTTVNYYVELSKPIDSPVTFKIDPVSDRIDSHEFLPTTYQTVPAGSTLYTGQIVFKGSYFNSESDVTNISVTIEIFGESEVDIPEENSMATLVAVGEDAFPGLEKCYFHFSGYPATTIDAPSSGYREVSMYIGSENNATPGKEVTLTFEVTVAETGLPAVLDVDYSLPAAGRYPIVTSVGYAYGYLNILPGAAGKTLQVRLVSDDTTIGTNSVYTVTVNEALPWPPPYRKAPSDSPGYSWSTYSIVVANLFVNKSEESIYWQYGQGWLNKYMDQTSDIEVPLNAGEVNTLDIGIFSGTPSHNESAFLIVYADFDGDGQFVSAGEEITVQQLDKAALDATTADSPMNVPITITPPAMQSAPFALRIGVMYVHEITTLSAFKEVFKDGYFVDAAGITGSYMQVCDYKGVIE